MMERSLPSPRQVVLSVFVASLITTCVCLAHLSSGPEPPLPAFAWAAAFIFLVVEQDVRRTRIPNALTFPALGAALAFGAWTGGLPGFAAALGGALVPVAALFLPFRSGGIKAGDVKALMVLGALWGWITVLSLLWWSLIAGGVIAIALLVARGGLSDVVQRWAASLGVTFSTLKPTYMKPAPGSVAAGGLPFGVAIGLAVAAERIWGIPWA